MKARGIWASGLLALLLAGCAQPGPIQPPPILDLTSRNDCAAKPDLGLAHAVILDKDRKASVTAIVDQTAPCLEQMAGTKSLYTVFELPADDPSSVVTVASATAGGGVFAPHVVLLDAQGLPLRELERDKFLFRGSELSVLFRQHADDHYVLVASDPSVVGKSFVQVSETTSSQTMGTGTAAGPVYFTVYSGKDVSGEYVYAHTGAVTVTITPVSQSR
jgi:hypothetical protein